MGSKRDIVYSCVVSAEKKSKETITAGILVYFFYSAVYCGINKAAYLHLAQFCQPPF